MTTYKFKEIGNFQKALNETISKNGYCVICLDLQGKQQATITFNKRTSYNIGVYEKEYLLSMSNENFSINVWFDSVTIISD